jgi:hypothetical protein
MGEDGALPSTREDLFEDLEAAGVSAEDAGRVVEAREARLWALPPPQAAPLDPRAAVAAWGEGQVRYWAVQVVGVSQSDVQALALTGQQLLDQPEEELLPALLGTGVTQDAAAALVAARRDQHWAITQADVEGWTPARVAHWALHVVGVSAADVAAWTMSGAVLLQDSPDDLLANLLSVAVSDGGATAIADARTRGAWAVTDRDVCTWDLPRLQRWAVEVVGLAPEEAAKILFTGDQVLMGEDGALPSTREDLFEDLEAAGVSAEDAGRVVEAREARWWEPVPPSPVPPVEVVPVTRDQVKAFTREQVATWAKDALGMSDADAAALGKIRGGIVVAVKEEQLRAWPLSEEGKAALRRAVQEDKWGFLPVTRPQA